MVSNTQHRIFGPLRLSVYRQLLVFIAGAFFLVLGFAWLHAFLVMGIRPQHAAIMVPAGVLAILLALGLFLRRRIAVLVSLAVAVPVMLFSIYIQISQLEIYIPLAISGLVSLAYLSFLAPTVWGDFKSRGELPRAGSRLSK